jgi:hypothetical protein
MMMILLNSGRFQGRQSRSFPELSDTIKERVPIRQLSDSQQSSKNGQTKLPVASSRFPAVETNNEGNSCGNNKNPYSFGPNYKSKYQQKFNESNGKYCKTSYLISKIDPF